MASTCTDNAAVATTGGDGGVTSTSSDLNGHSKADTIVNATGDNEKKKKMTIKPHHDEGERQWPSREGVSVSEWVSDNYIHRTRVKRG